MTSTREIPDTHTVALKEWGAAIHGLLDGRQTILLRKGGIHEKAFATPESGGGFVLYPTVAHTHADRTRPEHHDLLSAGDADARADAVTIRAGVLVVGVVEVARPTSLPDLADLHIWTDASIVRDRVQFRPAKPLQILVVQAIALPGPVVVPRTEEHAGCRSWIDLDPLWDGTGAPVHRTSRLREDLDRVRLTVG